MSISEFVRRPVPWGLRRTRAVSAAKPAAGHGGIPVLRLVCDLTGGRAGGVDQAVLAWLARRGAVDTVVLDLGSGAGLDDDTRRALWDLRAALQSRGTGLRFVVTSREVRADLAVGEYRLGLDAVHDCARAAMLAAFAQAPGPGLVGTVMRDALAAPPDIL